MDDLSKQLTLPPPPLLPWQRLAKARRLRQELTNLSLEAYVEKQVDTMEAWQEIEDDPVARRFYRNATILFTREELEVYHTAKVRNVLGQEARSFEEDR